MVGGNDGFISVENINTINDEFDTKVGVFVKHIKAEG